MFTDNWLLHSNNWRFVVCVFTLLAGIVGFSGSINLPVDGHEVLVLQTTQEMANRNDWILPWFNDEPRLNKPPLNYWATSLVAWFSGSLHDIRPWHGRMPSVLAGMGMAALILLLGQTLKNRMIGLMAAGFFVSNIGFVTYTHDARPEMLYAFLCTLGFAAFAFAWKTKCKKTRILYSYLIWLSYALATLCKGPHMPAMYLLASIIFCWRLHMSWKEAQQLFRPISGILLFVVLTLPWWYLVHYQLGDSGLQNTQLAGSLLTIDLTHIFNFYYFYRPLQLLLPWIVFIPFAIALTLNTKRSSAEHLFLTLLVIVPIILLSFGPQQRWH